MVNAVLALGVEGKLHTLLASLAIPPGWYNPPLLSLADKALELWQGIVAGVQACSHILAWHTVCAEASHP